MALIRSIANTELSAPAFSAKEMISFPLVNGHDDESRASTQARQAIVTSLDPETLSYDNALREAHNTLLELPSTSQTHIRYSVTSFNEQLDEISADEGMFLEVTFCARSLTSYLESSNERTQNQLNDSGDDTLRSERRSTEKVYISSLFL